MVTSIKSNNSQLNQHRTKQEHTFSAFLSRNTCRAAAAMKTRKSLVDRSLRFNMMIVATAVASRLDHVDIPCQ